jgi:acetyl-CoA carboxylase biotin carboxylase subunit
VSAVPAIRKVLVANRGEIASRIMRTCRAMGIDTVAIYSDPDRNAPFVRDADEAVYIGPPMAAASFLAIEKMVDYARRTGADAVHPGYGFLAENADFAAACEAAGVTFIGPSPDAIRRMGSKSEAKRIMAAAGVPVVPGFDAVGLADRDIAARARELGYPVLIKASAGGGGKGMRVVREPERLPAALEAARREAKGAFGDDALLVERYFESPRHVEIQILGDAHGTLLHCFERECSIQRRHQKIIEEAPSPALDDALRARMAAAAVTAGRAIGYRNAGTVEFILDQNGAFYFLEVNTRLQVEHPVTEEVTGLDLVRLQILVAQGEPLPLRQEDLALRGHAIEARLYAEDPRADFLPSTGTILRWQPGCVPGVRWESGVERGSEVTIHYDPMLAKVIAHAPTRAEAARRLAKALAETRVHGVRTNLALLVEILRHPEFLAGRLDTHFIEKHLVLDRPPTPTEREADRVHAVAAALWLQERRRAEAPVLRSVPSGWRNSPSRMQDVAFICGEETIRVEYRLRGRHAVVVAIAGAPPRGAIAGSDGVRLYLVLFDVRRGCTIAAHGDAVWVQSALGASELHEVPRFPPPAREEVRGGCRAPMPGKILQVRVEPGQTVRKGDVLAILEAMKMEHEVGAARRRRARGRDRARAAGEAGAARGPGGGDMSTAVSTRSAAVRPGSRSTSPSAGTRLRRDRHRARRAPRAAHADPAVRVIVLTGAGRPSARRG